MVGFSFKGIHISDYNTVANCRRPLTPKLKVEYINAQNQDGAIISGNCYENIIITADITIMSDVINNGRNLSKLLIGRGELILDSDPSRIYDATVVEIIDFTKKANTAICTAKFNCYPFPHSDDISVESDFTNNGDLTSYPICVFETAGSITCNGVTMTVTEACTVDCKKMVVYKDGVNKMSAFTGDFIEFKVGENTLETTGTVTITYKEWYRW